MKKYVAPVNAALTQRDIELRQWCLQQAIHVTPTSESPTAMAEKIWKWVFNK